MRKYLWLIPLCLLALSQSYAQRTIYVSKGGANNSPYLNWPDAATNIQDAINVAADSDVVQLSNDVYVSTGAYASNSFLFITNAITLRGFSAESPANTVIDGGNPDFTNGVIYMDNANARLEQVWVRNGYTTLSNLPPIHAGGVSMPNGTISNCWVTGCTNTSYGAGGVYMNNGLITHSVISNNVNTRFHMQDWPMAFQAGGVLMSGSARINNSQIVTNRTTGNCIAGGVCTMSSGTIFSNCNISYNYTEGRGGGIFGNGTISKMYNCTLIGNFAPGGVGGGACADITLMEYCSIVSNFSIRGGGLDLGGSSLTMRNCLVSANTTAALKGGGLACGMGLTKMTLESCTVVGNKTTAGRGGGIWLFKSGSVFSNCIIYANSATTPGSDDIYQDGSGSDASLSNTIAYCCINSNLSKAVGLVTNDPKLVSSAGGDCRLIANSPCLNVGSNQAWMYTARDLDGNPRIDDLYNAVDIGAYEHKYSVPIIVVQPQSQTNNPGSSVTFSLTASGWTPLIYQWQKDSTNITGATSVNYTITSVAKTNEGNYRCIVTNMLGSVTSLVASLTVNDPPSITTEPVSLTNNPGSSASFSVTATGTAPLFYQWQKNSTNITDAISTNYTIASVTETNEGDYRCIVTNMAGSVTSLVASLTVNDPPSITTEPVSLTNNPGSSASFSVTATGTAPLFYQWQKNSTNISGAASTSYTITSVAKTNEGNYLCIVTNMAGSVTSLVATLTVNDPPTITTQPVSLTNNPGSSASFSLTAIGTAPLIYQWQKNNANISGADSMSYTIASVAETNEGSYRCIVTNMAGSVTSLVATLTVNDPPAVPSGLIASDGDYTNKVALIWNAAESAIGYQIFRHTSNNSDSAGQIGTATSTAYDDTGAIAGTPYYYWVKATNSAGASGFSASDSGYRALSPPTGVSASDGTYSNKVHVIWKTSSGATSYEVWRHTNNNTGVASKISIPDPTGTNYDDTNVVVGRIYYYWVKAKNATQTSGFSNPDKGCASDNHPINNYDGAGKSDLTVYRDGYWYIYSLFNGSILLNGKWGALGWTPVQGDYDGDGQSDLAVYGDGYWYIYSLANGNILLNGKWGAAGWRPVPGDYDGDGKSDLAVYNGGYWYIYSLANGSILLNGKWGAAGWSPVPGDYDGDGKSDLAVYGDGYWYIYSLANGSILLNGKWGALGWSPVPGDYDGDGKSDLAVYANGYWYIYSLANGSILQNGKWGAPGWISVPGDYDGDGKSDLAVYGNGYWYIYSLANGNILVNGKWGDPGWIPVQ